MPIQDKPIQTFGKQFQFRPIKLAESTKSQSTREPSEEDIALTFFDDQGEKGEEYCGKVH